MRTSIVIVIFGAMCLAGANEVTAAPAGKVVYAYGEAQVQDSAGQSRPVRKGDEVTAGQTLVTQNGRLQVHFADGGLVAMQPATQFRIDEYNYAGKEDGSERSFFNLVRGGVRFVTGAIGHTNKQNYKIKTVVATIGIRGSAGLAVMCVGGGCPGRVDGLYLTGNQDTLTLENETGTQDVQPGETYHVKCQSCDAKEVEQGPEAHVDVEGEEEPLAEEGDEEEALDEFIAEATGETVPEFIAGDEREASGQPVSVGSVTGNISFRTVAQSSLFNTIDDVPPGFSSFDTSSNPQFQETGFTNVVLSTNALLAYEFQSDQFGTSKFDSSGATLTDTGSSSAAGGAFWGRWVGNYSASRTDVEVGTLTFSNEPGGFHFIFGSAFSGDLATLQSTLGSATYTAAGGTSPTDQFGAVGIFQGGQISVNFSTAIVDGNFGVLMPSGEQFATTFRGSVGPGFPGDSVRINSGLGGTCSGGSCSAGAPIFGQLNGGFTGLNAEGLITNYFMFGGGSTVIGTQAYAR